MSAAVLIAAIGAGGTDPGEVGDDTARRAAREILSEGRFQEQHVPRPFRGVLEWIGDRLQGVGDFLGDVLDAVTGGGDSPIGWAAIALVVVVVVAILASRIARRRTPTRRPATDPLFDPDDRRSAAELEADAEVAERAGRGEEALRLRFRAGLLRLDDAGAIDLRPSVTSGEVRRRLREPTFDALASDFDEVAYGGRAADDARLERARRDWPAIVRRSAPR